MIMAWSPRVAGQLPCYTFNGPYRDCADVKLARRIAGACGQPHRTLQLGDDFLKQFPVLAAESVRVSDGSMDVTGAAEIYANRLARQIAPARLTGNYGSEILRRYVAFRPRNLASGTFSESLAPHFKAAVETYAEEARCH